MESPILTSTEQGTRTDPHPLVQQPGVTYVLNGRPEAGGSGDYLWSNEPANELAFVFPVGKQLVGSLLLTELNRTLFFLAGLNGLPSEIGYGLHTLRPETYTNSGQELDNSGAVSSIPLEPDRSPVGQYRTLLTAACLDFDAAGLLDDPTYQFKGQDLYIYLADGQHPDRLIRFLVDEAGELTLHTDSRVITGQDDCGAPVYGLGLDCSRCRLDPLVDGIRLTVQSVQPGGSWEAGSVRFLAAYSTPSGERLTEFLTTTGNVPIWENALQTRSGQATGQSITLNLSTTTDKYTHVVIGALQTIGSQVQAFSFPPFPVTGQTLVLRGNETRLPLSLSDLLEGRTHYEHSKGLATTEDRLLRWGLEEKAVPNLQQYLLNIPVEWETIQLPEGAYKDGVIAARYKSEMRDEVLALGIVFEYDDGDETGVFHLPGRAATLVDRVPVQNEDVVSYLKTQPGRTTPVQTWEIYNTAARTGTPHIPFQGVNTPGSWERGTMGYWQSSLTYPNRPDVWGPLCGKPIQHHRLPDSKVTHIQSGESTTGLVLPLQKAGHFIYPLGIRVDGNAIRQAIAQAEAAGVVPAGRIKRYRIVRADRTGQASILARGLLYNLNQYTRKGKNYLFPNYPFNDLRADPFLTADPDTYKKFKTPATGLAFTRQDRYTFHSPDVHFTPVGRGSYLRLETEAFGQSEGSYREAEEQAKYKLETPDLRLAAYAAGVLEAKPVLDVASSKTLRMLKALSFSEPFRILLQTALPFQNFGVQYVGVGWYNQFKQSVQRGFQLRSISDQALLEPELQQVGGVTINNRFREKSIYLDATSNLQLPPPSVPDESRWSITQVGETNKVLNKPISSYYGTLKAYQPAQYGRLAGIQYLELGKPAVDLSTEGFQTYFGGDTFINRFSLKRKHSFFNQTRYGQPNGTDINYSDLPNAALPNYFFNLDGLGLIDLQDVSIPETPTSAFNDAISRFKSNLNSVISFFSGGSSDPVDVTTLADSAVRQAIAGFISQTIGRFDLDKSTLLYYKGYIYLYSYGIPYFFCESAVNVDLREAGDLQQEGFYPLTDPDTWTQEGTVPIQKENSYRYDKAYSHPLRENKLLPYPDHQLYNQLGDKVHPNRVIYSEPGNWRYYKALNSYDFERKTGILTGLNGLQGDRVLARFTDGSALFNAYVQLQTGPEIAQVGSGGMFATRPQAFAQADGGLLGSQHRAFCRTPYGDAWVDQKRGGVYLLPPGGSPTPLHQGTMEHWLRNNLPSRLVQTFGELPAQFYPIRLVYDAINKRIILTKRDYYQKQRGLSYVPGSGVFLGSNNQPVPFGHPDWFGFCGFTLSYHLPSKRWSFLSYVPNYLLPFPTGFVSILNTPEIDKSGSAWIHRNSRLQYQRFFGRLDPFELSVWLGPLGQNTHLDSVQYSHDVRRYHQADQFVTVEGKTYDSLAVTTDRQTTGVIPLLPGNFSQMRDLLRDAPRLYQSLGGSWSINGLHDKTAPGNTLPLWVNDPSNTRKWISQDSLRKADSLMTSSDLSGTGYTLHFSQHGDDKHQYIHNWVKPNLKP